MLVSSSFEIPIAYSLQMMWILVMWPKPSLSLGLREQQRGRYSMGWKNRYSKLIRKWLFLLAMGVFAPVSYHWFVSHHWLWSCIGLDTNTFCIDFTIETFLFGNAHYRCKFFNCIRDVPLYPNNPRLDYLGPLGPTCTAIGFGFSLADWHPPIC